LTHSTRTITPDKVHTTIGAHMLADGFDVVLDLDESRGVRLHDSKSGRDFLDFFTCFASSPIGFNHPKLMTPEFIERLGRVSVNKPSNSDLYTVEMAEFVETFGRLATPEDLPHLFFVSGGALAVENALKVAFDWKVRLNMARGINRADAADSEMKGSKVIHFRQCFHGRSGYTLSLTNTFDPRKTQYFPKFDWPRVLNPKARFPLEGKNLEDTVTDEKEALAQIASAIDEHGPDIAAMIIEPIQGEGGDNHFRPEFMKALREVADEHDIMLIFDEIQTGMGLTGTMWAFQQLGVTPDIACFGKKAQICGIMVSDRVDEVRDNVFQMSSRINSTWGGNLTDMVRCQRYLEVMHEEKMVENAAAMGERFQKGLHAIGSDHVRNIRGRGLMCAFDLPTTELRNAALVKIKENGMMALPCGPVSIRFRPPLNVTEAEIDEANDILSTSINSL
jgi:L-lysine 6-transaminase